MKHCCAIVMCLVALAALPVRAEQTPWRLLFDGRTLDGWMPRGGKAVYAATNGCIVGTTVPRTDNSFLCTTRDYSNFVLELEFKVEPDLNSGIQFRSHSTPSYKKGRVHGYQYEIDLDPTRNRWWVGGLYDEARRGWLYPGTNGGDRAMFTAQGRALSRTNDWNRVRIEANGPRIRTWLNAVARVDCTDEMDAAGFIALQVHAVGDLAAPLVIQWRNIRIRELAAAPPGDNPEATGESPASLPLNSPRK